MTHVVILYLFSLLPRLIKLFLSVVYTLVSPPSFSLSLSLSLHIYIHIYISVWKGILTVGTQAVSQTAPAVRSRTWAFRTDTSRLQESLWAPRGLLWPLQAQRAWPGPSAHASSLPAWLCVSRKRRRTNAAKHSQTAMSSPQTCRIRRCLCVQKEQFSFHERNFSASLIQSEF